MQITKPTYTMTLSEQDLAEAVAYWIKNVHKQNIKIKNIQHLVGTRTDGHGMMEIDIPYQEGLKITVEEK